MKNGRPAGTPQSRRLLWRIPWQIATAAHSSSSQNPTRKSPHRGLQVPHPAAENSLQQKTLPGTARTMVVYDGQPDSIAAGQAQESARPPGALAAILFQ